MSGTHRFDFESGLFLQCWCHCFRAGDRRNGCYSLVAFDAPEMATPTLTESRSWNGKHGKNQGCRRNSGNLRGLEDGQR